MPSLGKEGMLVLCMAPADIDNFNKGRGVPGCETYKTSEGKFMAMGAVETTISEQFLKGLRLSPVELSKQPSLPECPRLKHSLQT